MRLLLDTNVWIDAHAGKTDAIIAATALLQQAEVLTRNTSDFKKISGLSVLDTQNF